jgi:DNA-binding NtrC family response regulator
MPGIIGPEVLKCARRKITALKAILIPSYSSDGAISALLGSGDFAYLSKPYSMKELRQVAMRELETDAGEARSR